MNTQLDQIDANLFPDDSGELPLIRAIRHKRLQNATAFTEPRTPEEEEAWLDYRDQAN